MSLVDDFVRIRSTAKDLPDATGYNPYAGEMNPAIFSRLLAVVKERGLVPEIWEQFSSPVSMERFGMMAEDVKVSLYSWGLRPFVKRGYSVDDSTMDWPRFETDVGVGGVLMHPPYFGSSVMSEGADELSAVKDPSEYRRRLWAAFRTAARALQVGGVVCAVGRRYRFGGEEIPLDRWMVESAQAVGFGLEEVWKSCPDVAILFVRR